MDGGIPIPIKLDQGASVSSTSRISSSSPQSSSKGPVVARQLPERDQSMYSSCKDNNDPSNLKIVKEKEERNGSVNNHLTKRNNSNL